MFFFLRKKNSTGNFLVAVIGSTILSDFVQMVKIMLVGKGSPLTLSIQILSFLLINIGRLEKEKAKRLIHNYNQIYDLCLSPLKIAQAFQPFRSGQDMPLQPLLDYLKEL